MIFVIYLCQRAKVKISRGSNLFFPTVYIYIYIYIYTLTKIINATLLFLPPFFMSWTQRSMTDLLCTQKAYFSQILFTNLSKSVLVSTAYGREINIQFTGSSSGGHSCCQHANCTLPQNVWHNGIVLCDKTDFRVAFYCAQPKAHLCNNHAV